MLDAILGPRERCEASEDVRRFRRRNVVKYSAGVHRRFEAELQHVEKPLHIIVCPQCSPTELDRERAWAALAGQNDCCKSAFGRKLCRLRAEHALEAAEMAVEMREKIRLASTKNSESAHAHAQRVLGRAGNKPTSLATFARKAFLAKLASTHHYHGGDLRWDALSNVELQRSEAQLACEEGHAEGDDQAQLRLALALDGQGDGAAIANPVGGAIAVSGDEGLACGHLNPVLALFNKRQRTAKSLGIHVDSEFRERVLRDIEEQYHSPGSKAAIMHEHKQYLQNFENKENPPAANKPLKSTFWGWGTETLPLPIQAVKAHVDARGLAPAAVVKSHEANDDFRVTADEVNHFVPLEITEGFQACGACPLDVCRKGIL